MPRQTVTFPAKYSPGTIIVNTANGGSISCSRGGQAIRYGIGVGRVGFTWAGVTAVSGKKEWPDWTPPEQMLKRRPDLPRSHEGRHDNPLGARAMYLGSSLYRIHGSNEPETIGTATSSGCFRMTNDDVIDLYNRVRGRREGRSCCAEFSALARQPFGGQFVEVFAPPCGVVAPEFGEIWPADKFRSSACRRT